MSISSDFLSIQTQPSTIQCPTQK